jgi:eukaryotic-like serine/threonine-protein kinase
VSRALGGPVWHLGSGAFGDTWRHKNAAVKILCGQPVEQARLQREVDGLSRVCSPYVVHLDSTGTVKLRGQDYHTLVFEYIEGDDVEKRLVRGDQPSAEEAEAFLRGLLTGVGQLHETTTVHRDIKPANIVLRGNDWRSPVLIDLGLARADGESTITLFGGPVGTLIYMAPEVLLGQAQRPAGDLFAVGVTVRQVLSGQHPFYDGTEKSPAEMARKVARGPRPLPDGVPVHIAEVLDRLTDVRKAPRGSAFSCLQQLGGEGAAA